ncbi:MAG: hypothetical protein ACP5K9_01430 [Candidatus Micrarchaeia archaeon]
MRMFENQKDRASKKYDMPMIVALSVLVFFFLLPILMLPVVRSGEVLSLVTLGTLLGKYIILFLPLLFCMMFGAYLLRAGKEYTKVALILIFAAILIISLYYFAEYAFHFFPDDEAYICFLSTKAFLNGTNPYAISFSQQVYDNMLNMSYTPTTNNDIIGTINYPALYMLSFLPFYLLLPPTMKNLSTEMSIQAGVFIFILLLTIALLLDKKHIARPRYSVIIFLLFAIAIVSSTQTFLMLALILIAYASIDSKYSWLMLGIAASIQEELWLPVLLLITYSFTNKGIRRGAYDLLGAIFVFALINGYFIASSPTAYFRDVFSPIGKLLLPLPSSLFGYPLLQLYNVTIPSLTTMFAISALLMVLLFAFLNEKKLVPIFSMVPLMFPHALGSYFTFFIAFAVIVLFMKEGAAPRRKVFLQRHRLAVAAVALLLVVAGFYAILASHNLYKSDFGVSISNQSLISIPQSNESRYSAEIHYMGNSNTTAYLFFYTYANNTIYISGFGNSSLIKQPQRCSTNDYRCLLNVNKITLQAGVHEYALNATINWPKASGNYTKKAYRIDVADAIIYSGDYFYNANMTAAS